MTGSEQSSRREAVLLALGCFVVMAEVVLVFIQQAFPNHPVPSAFHGIALVVATSLFGTAALSARKAEKNGNGA